MKTVRERLEAAMAEGKDVWTAGGADEAQIQALERSLEVRLPPSYRQFLASTGALNLNGIEVAGIMDGDAMDLSGGSAFGETMRARDEFALPPTLLVIQPDGDAPHCIDLASADSSGEMRAIKSGMSRHGHPPAASALFVSKESHLLMAEKLGSEKNPFDRCRAAEYLMSGPFEIGQTFFDFGRPHRLGDFLEEMVRSSRAAAPTLTPVGPEPVIGARGPVEHREPKIRSLEGTLNRFRMHLTAIALPVVVGALYACSTVPVASNTSQSATIAANAKRSLAAASTEIENRNFAEANTLLREALRELGDTYHSPNSVDDTGMSLVLADSEEQKGRKEVAANLRWNVLSSRLALLEQRKVGP